MRAAVVALCALSGALGACASAPRLADLHPAPAARELESTPFFPQDEYQCGPAALATVLAAGGVAVTPEELVSKVYVPGRKGSLQAELVSTTRNYGRMAYRLRPELADLLQEVGAGNPVLVLQNLGLSFWPAWHYAVLIGYDTDRNELILRSGSERRQRLSLRRFAQSWGLAERWAIAVVPPDRPPASAQPREWLVSASAFEELGQAATAAIAYRAATTRWPEYALGWQLLGNALYAQRDLTGAEHAFRRALAMEPSAASHNNLAQVLLERGCLQQARTQVQQAVASSTDEAELAVFRKTLAEIDAYRGPVGRDYCPAGGTVVPPY